MYEIFAIIPTTGRPDLCQALLSAKGQEDTLSPKAQEGTRGETVVSVLPRGLLERVALSDRLRRRDRTAEALGTAGTGCA
ncbi:MAG: hypothetical protein QG608_675 [Actinomycetota bacterium]|nr:hypothetical protein [Actinomycetota bacterium]